MNIKKILTKINNIIPKFKIVIFNSNPDFADNAYSLYSYLLENRSDVLKKYKIIWACNNRKSLKNQKIKFGKIIYKKSFLGLLYFFIAEKIICTHNYFYDVKSGKNQTIYNLWHGCGYKKLKNDREYYRGDYTFVTSLEYKKIQGLELNIPQENVIITGLARNDKLFRRTNCLEKLGIYRDKYSQLVIWLPTFRRSISKELGNDGCYNLFGINEVLERPDSSLLDWLKNKKILLIIKPHPLEKIDDLSIHKSDNIMFLTNDMMHNIDVDLYDILQETDVLLSDYSSVIVDYLLLDKPIALICSDYTSYETDRGFMFENCEEYLPGPIIKNEEEFINYIKQIDEINEEWREKRILLKNKLHRYQDDKSSERVAKFIFGNYSN